MGQAVILSERRLFDLVRVVVEMRRVQRAYFASKGDKELLIQAKRLEAAVDVQAATLLREPEGG